MPESQDLDARSVQTPHGWPYPLPGDTPDIPRDIKALAEFANANVPRFEVYSLAVADLIAGGVRAATLTFPPGRFTVPPFVWIVGISTGYMNTSIGVPSAVNVGIRVHNPGASTAGGVSVMVLCLDTAP